MKLQQYRLKEKRERLQVKKSKSKVTFSPFQIINGFKENNKSSVSKSDFDGKSSY